MPRKLSSPRRLTCRSARQLAPRPAHGGAAIEAAVGQHSGACAGCAQWARTMRAAIAVFGTVSKVEAPAAQGDGPGALAPRPARWPRRAAARPAWEACGSSAARARRFCGSCAAWARRRSSCSRGAGVSSTPGSRCRPGAAPPLQDRPHSAGVRHRHPALAGAFGPGKGARFKTRNVTSTRRFHARA
jgi:hypothetical protein